MDQQNENTNNIQSFGRQFMVFLTTLNLGILFALGWLYLKTDQQRKDLENRELQVEVDLVHYRDSLRRDTNFLKSVAPLIAPKINTASGTSVVP
jgi:hypothetical protein